MLLVLPAPSRKEQPLSPPGREAGAAGGVSSVKPEGPGPSGTSRPPRARPQGKGGLPSFGRWDPCVSERRGDLPGPPWRQEGQATSALRSTCCDHGSPRPLRAWGGEPPTTGRHPHDRRFEIRVQAGSRRHRPPMANTRPGGAGPSVPRLSSSAQPPSPCCAGSR